MNLAKSGLELARQVDRPLDRRRRVARHADHEEADGLHADLAAERDRRSALVDDEALLERLEDRVVADLDAEHHAAQAGFVAVPQHLLVEQVDARLGHPFHLAVQAAADQFVGELQALLLADREDRIDERDLFHAERFVQPLDLVDDVRHGALAAARAHHVQRAEGAAVRAAAAAADRALPVRPPGRT